MKVKILVGILICLFLSFCATSSHEETWKSGRKTLPQRNVSPDQEAWRLGPGTTFNVKILAQESISYGDKTYDEIGQNCLKALTNMGYIFHIIDGGQGEIVAVRNLKEGSFSFAGRITQDEKTGKTEIEREQEGASIIYFSVSISQKEEEVHLNCKVMERIPGFYPQSRAKREIERFLEALDKNLN